LHPPGKASLGDSLARALQDFPATDEGKVLILITDGADNDGVSFCDRRVVSDLPEGLRFHLFSLDLQDPEERQELDCLSRQLGGAATHLSAGQPLSAKLSTVVKDAHAAEAERQARLLEEKRRLALLHSKTRLKVEFENTLDLFFADSLEVLAFRVDGREIPLDAPPRIRGGEKAVILDEPIPKGPHHLELQYRMWRGDESIPSRVGALEIQVPEGETATVLAFPKSALFHWGCLLKAVSP